MWDLAALLHKWSWFCQHSGLSWRLIHSSLAAVCLLWLRLGTLCPQRLRLWLSGRMDFYTVQELVQCLAALAQTNISHHEKHKDLFLGAFMKNFNSKLVVETLNRWVQLCFAISRVRGGALINNSKWWSCWMQYLLSLMPIGHWLILFYRFLLSFLTLIFIIGKNQALWDVVEVYSV